MKLIGWIVLGLVGIAFVAFATHNYHFVEVNPWPAPLILSLPVYSLVFGGIVLGFLGGALVAWMGGGKGRRKTREIRRAARKLERQVEAGGGVPAVRAG
ncbi:MAG: LapA family protein [Rhodospirillaceae bacterium]|nr:LapA family protein [Rhodospirillaceae bacterium]